MTPAYVLFAFLALIVVLGIWAHFDPDRFEPKEPGQ